MPGVTVRIVRDASLVRTVRLVAAAVARRAGREEDFVEEVRLAVGEACGLLVAAPAKGDAPVQEEDDPVREQDVVTVRIEIDDSFTVWVSTAEATPEEINLGYGPLEPWALLRGLVDDFAVHREGGRLELRMGWPGTD